MTNLPERDENHELEEESSAFFESIVDKKLYICHAGDKKDYGVDYRLELVQDSKFVTNIHIHAQLKGHKQFEYSSGRVKQTLKTSTLHYLLNQPYSVLVSYSRHDKKVMYVVLTDKMLFAINPDWQAQERLTIYLDNEFTSSAQSALHSEALERHRILKSVNVHVDEISDDTYSHLILSHNNIVTEEQLVNDLKKYGHTLISRGDLRIVRQLLDRITKGRLNSDTALLVLQAHFHFNEGSLRDAEAAIKRFRRVAPDLYEQDDKFLRRLELNIRRIRGDLTEQEKEEWSNATILQNSPEFISLRSDVIKSRALARELSPTEVKAEYASLKELTTKLDGEIKEIISIQIESDELFLSSLYFDSAYIRMIGARLAHEYSGIEWPVEQRIKCAVKLQQHAEQVISGFVNLLERAAKSPSQSQYIDVLYTYAVSSISNMRTVIAISRNHPQIGLTAINPHETLERRLKQLDVCFNYWDSVGDYFRSAGALDSKFNVLMLMDRKSEAQEVSSNFVKRVTRFGLDELEKFIGEDANGTRQLIYTAPPEFNDEENDSRDVAPENHAQHFMEAFDLPSDRYENVLAEMKALNRIEHLQFDHCRYTELFVPLAGQDDPKTMYIRRPDFRVHCDKFDYTSKLAGEDINAVVKSFVGSYCMDCPSREPRVKK